MGLDLLHVVPVKNVPNNEHQDYFTAEELSILPSFFDKYQSWLVDLDDDETGHQKVLYYRKIGYQRKGMNKRFYTDFENDQLYCYLSDVQRAYQYLQGDHINTLKELQDNFNQYFIGNFTEGESIFIASW